MGIFYLILLFFVCLGIVIVWNLTMLGFKSLKQNKPEAPQEQSKEQAPQAVYYLVEKKKPRRAKYSEPKEITFK